MTLEEQKEALKKYIIAKLEQNDLHGVRDAAFDLEVLEYKSQIESLKNESKPQKCKILGTIDLKKV